MTMYIYMYNLHTYFSTSSCWKYFGFVAQAYIIGILIIGVQRDHALHYYNPDQRSQRKRTAFWRGHEIGIGVMKLAAANQSCSFSLPSGEVRILKIYDSIKKHPNLGSSSHLSNPIINHQGNTSTLYNPINLVKPVPFGC